MTDQIHIAGLSAVTIVGALEHEREIAQPLEIDLVLDVDLHDAGATPMNSATPFTTARSPSEW